jgi:hypothetical protein
MTEQTIAEIAPARIALIIDGVVADVLNTDDRLAAIFLSQPKVVDVTEISQSEFITSGYLYNEELNTFTKFAVEEVPGPVTDAVAEGHEIPKDPSSTED